MHDLYQHLDHAIFHSLSHPCEAEHFLEDLEGDLFRRDLAIQDMLLEESILTVHMGAVEQPISVDDILPVVLAYVVRIVIFLVLDVVLVTLDVLSDDCSCSRQRLSGITIVLEAKYTVLTFSCWSLLVSFIILSSCSFGPLLVVECGIESTKFIVEIYEDVGSRHLDKGVVPRLQEYDVLFVEVAKERVS